MKSAISFSLISFLLMCAPAVAAGRAKIGAAPPPFTLKSVSGSKVSLSGFKGKVVLLDFWATWCPPCRFSTPAMINLSEKYKGKDFVVIGVSMDEDSDDVLPYVQKEKIRHAVLYGGDSSVGQDYGIRAIPTFFLIDRKGIVQKIYPGFESRMQQTMEADIDQILSQK